MDTADLLAAVERRLAETMRDRDRLAEAVAALNDELHQQQDEAEALVRLISRFAGHPGAETRADGQSADEHGADDADGQSADEHGADEHGADEHGADEHGADEQGADADPSSILWPVGPGFDQPIKTKKLKAWAKYKMEAADWYLDALLAMSLQDGRVRRVLGVEMAVEGVIQSLCAGFEVMVCVLTQSIEKAAGVPADRRTPLHLASWSQIAAAAKVFDIDLASSLSVSAALLGEHSEEPDGPLAQLLVLRGRATVQDLLVDVTNGGEADVYIDVPGRGPLPLVDYLFEARNLVGELLETILHDVADAKSGRLYISASNGLRERAEHGLGVILAPDGLLAS